MVLVLLLAFLACLLTLSSPLLSFFTTSAVVGGFSALVSGRPCELLPFDDFFALLVISLLGVVDLSVMALIFDGDDS